MVYAFPPFLAIGHFSREGGRGVFFMGGGGGWACITFGPAPSTDTVHTKGVVQQHAS